MNTETKEIFSDKLNFIYLEIPKFNKQQAELESHFEKWIYIIKNLAKLDNIPPELQEKIFKEVFELSEIAKYDRNNRDIYEESLKAKRDWKNSLDTSFFKGLEAGKLQGIEVGIEKGIEVGIEKGIEKNKLEMAKNAKAMGLNISDIIKLTGLPKEQIERL